MRGAFSYPTSSISCGWFPIAWIPLGTPSKPANEQFKRCPARCSAQLETPHHRIAMDRFAGASLAGPAFCDRSAERSRQRLALRISSTLGASLALSFAVSSGATFHRQQRPTVPSAPSAVARRGVGCAAFTVCDANRVRRSNRARVFGVKIRCNGWNIERNERHGRSGSSGQRRCDCDRWDCRHCNGWRVPGHRWGLGEPHRKRGWSYCNEWWILDDQQPILDGHRRCGGGERWHFGVDRWRLARERRSTGN